jgi:hypothetical protein
MPLGSFSGANLRAVVIKHETTRWDGPARAPHGESRFGLGILGLWANKDTKALVSLKDHILASPLSRGRAKAERIGENMIGRTRSPSAFCLAHTPSRPPKDVFGHTLLRAGALFNNIARQESMPLFGP